MNLNEINEAVAKIEATKNDDEVAHGMEDDLREAFIRHVAETAGGDLAEMARAVLKTNEIDFCRWCA